MNQLRFWTIALIIWLILVFNIERINLPVNIRSYTYIFVAIAAVIALMLPKADRLSYFILILIPVPSFLLFKAVGGGDSLWGEALPLTVTQVTGIFVTGLISRKISKGLREVEQLINDVTASYIGKLPRDFSEAQEEIYQELRRARPHQRPLSVIALKIDSKSVQLALPRLIQEVQQAMMSEYVFAGVARILNDNVSDYGTIARRGNHFVIVLPETSVDEAPEIAKTLEQLVREKMNVNLLAGTANFPGEAVTFEALMQIAMDDTEHKRVDPVKEGGAFRESIDARPSKLETDVSSQRANI